MKASKFTDAQMALILKQGADGHPVAEICRRVLQVPKRDISHALALIYSDDFDLSDRGQTVSIGICCGACSREIVNNAPIRICALFCLQFSKIASKRLGDSRT